MTFPNKLTRHSEEEKRLLSLTYQQIIDLVCTTAKNRARDSRPDAFKIEKRKKKTGVVTKANSMIKVWVSVINFKVFYPGIRN